MRALIRIVLATAIFRGSRATCVFALCRNLLRSCLRCFVFTLLLLLEPLDSVGLTLRKTLGVITPTAGASSELFGVADLKRPGSDVPLVLTRMGRLLGATSFPGLRGTTSGPYDVHGSERKIHSHGRSSQRKNKSVENVSVGSVRVLSAPDCPL